MCIRDRTDGRRTISQVTSTVDGYLSDMNNVMAVSYTHLDVYKRQGMVDAAAVGAGKDK